MVYSQHTHYATLNVSDKPDYHIISTHFLTMYTLVTLPQIKITLINNFNAIKLYVEFNTHNIIKVCFALLQIG